MTTRVTQENDPGLWTTLMQLWEAEDHPGWVVSGKKQYMVVQSSINGLREFIEQGAQSLYETTSFH